MRARTMLIIGLVALLAVIGLALMLPTISASVVTTTSSTPSFCVPVTPSCIWAMMMTG